MPFRQSAHLEDAVSKTKELKTKSKPSSQRASPKQAPSKAASAKPSAKSVKTSQSRVTAQKKARTGASVTKKPAKTASATKAPAKTPTNPTKSSGGNSATKKKVAAKPAAPKKKAVSAKTPAAAKKAATVKKAATAKKNKTQASSGSAKSSINKPAAKPERKKTAARKTGSRKKNYLTLKLPADYLPSDQEPFMSEEQKAYFRLKLVTWKEEIMRQTRETLKGLTAASEQHADVTDRATSETDRALELRARDRQRKLISKINSALGRIEEGSYGYCEDTGEPIGLRRLEARPIATLSLEAQERHERRERVFRED